MPTTYKVFRFKIDGSDVATARRLGGFDRFIFEFGFRSGSSTDLTVLYLIAARLNGTRIATVPYSNHPRPWFGGNYEDATLANDLILRRPYQITEAMLLQLDALNPGKTIDKIKIIANPNPYRHTAGNSAPGADPSDVNKDFIRLKIDVEY